MAYVGDERCMILGKMKPGWIAPTSDFKEQPEHDCVGWPFETPWPGRGSEVVHTRCDFNKGPPIVIHKADASLIDYIKVLIARRPCMFRGNDDGTYGSDSVVDVEDNAELEEGARMIRKEELPYCTIPEYVKFLNNVV